MGSLIFDTTFLIDYQKERKRGEGPAHRLLNSNHGTTMFMPVTVAGEFGEGFSTLLDPFYLLTIRSYQILPIVPATASIYAKISRQLRMDGRSIGMNDTWIAAIAIEHGFPLVTKNLNHFARIPNLQVVGY
jgi:predicted nucleic acid-binding protein